MKILKDASLFEGLPELSGDCRDGMRFYYQRARKSFAVHVLLYEKTIKNLLYTSSTAEVELLPGTVYRRKGAAFLSVEYVREGSMFVRQRGQSFRLDTGDIFLMQPNLDAWFLLDESCNCHKESFNIFGSLLPSFLQISGLGKTDVITGIDHYPVHRLFRRLSNLEPGTEPSALQENARLTFELLYYLVAPMKAEQVPKSLLDLKSLLESSLKNEHSVEEMAKFYGCTPCHLTRLFYKYFHTTPYKMLIDLRMKQASELLLQKPSPSIKEVTEIVGYRSQFSFSTEFKKRFGMSPKDYRDQFYA